MPPSDHTECFFVAGRYLVETERLIVDWVVPYDEGFSDSHPVGDLEFERVLLPRVAHNLRDPGFWFTFRFDIYDERYHGDQARFAKSVKIYGRRTHARIPPLALTRVLRALQDKIDFWQICPDVFSSCRVPTPIGAAIASHRKNWLRNVAATR